MSDRTKSYDIAGVKVTLREAPFSYSIDDPDPEKSDALHASIRERLWEASIDGKPLYWAGSGNGNGEFNFRPPKIAPEPGESFREAGRREVGYRDMQDLLAGLAHTLDKDTLHKKIQRLRENGKHWAERVGKDETAIDLQRVEAVLARHDIPVSDQLRADLQMALAEAHEQKVRG